MNLRKEKNAVLVVLAILLAVLSNYLWASESDNNGWDYVQSTIGEGLPIYKVFANTTDHRFQFIIDYAPDSSCIANFHIMPQVPLLKIERVGKVLIRFSTKKAFPFIGHRSNQRIIKILNFFEPDTSQFIKMLGVEKQFELLFQMNSDRYRETILTQGAVEKIKTAQKACIDQYLLEVKFVFPNSSERMLSKNEVKHMPNALLRIARNEIFARHGYVFQSKDLQKHFGRFEWYKPKTKDITLTEIERENIGLFKYYEEMRD